MYKYSNLEIEHTSKIFKSSYDKKEITPAKFLRVVDTGVSPSFVVSEQCLKKKFSSFILARILRLDYHHLKNARYFEKKYQLTRTTFIKIFNLYSVLSFKTIFKRIHNGYEEPLGETPGMIYKKV